jgi:hypothetical protein
VIGEDPVLVVVPRTALEAGLHSDLLSSGGGAAAPPRANGRAKSASDFEELITEVPETVPDPPTLTAVPPPLPEELRVMDGVTTEIPQGGDIAALAAQARGVADLLAAQASAMRDEAATYTKRIEQLEGELAARQQAIADVRQHLEAAVRLLAD